MCLDRSSLFNSSGFSFWFSTFLLCRKSTHRCYILYNWVYKLSRNRNVFVHDNNYRTCTVIISNRTCECRETAWCIVCTYAHYTNATHAKWKLQKARYLFRSIFSTSKVITSDELCHVTYSSVNVVLKTNTFSIGDISKRVSMCPKTALFCATHRISLYVQRTCYLKFKTTNVIGFFLFIGTILWVRLVWSIKLQRCSS